MRAISGQAVALAHAKSAKAGLSALEAIPDDAVLTYQPYWAAKAFLLAKAGDRAGAGAAFDRAIGLARSASVRAYLVERKRALEAMEQT